MATKQYDLAHAEKMAAHWLYLANMAAERGDYELEKRHLAREQKWHDIMNDLLGLGEQVKSDDQPQLHILACPPMNSSVVSYTGRIDAGAAHRAIAAARALVIAGVWNGKDPIAIHNPYDLENKLMRLEWEQKTAAELVAGVDYDIYAPTKPVIVEPPIPDDATELIPVVWTPEDEVSRLLDELTANLLQLELPSAAVTPNTYPDAFISVMVYTQDRTPYMTLIPKAPFETGLVYDQPQPFGFKRGDVVEFKIASSNADVWLKGVFYNIYPGDPRFACIRFNGVYEAARLADIRYPAVIDIFNGMADFDVKPAEVKAA